MSAPRTRWPEGEWRGCPLHDMTYFHGDISRHDGVTYPPCDVCGDTEPQIPQPHSAPKREATPPTPETGR